MNILKGIGAVLAGFIAITVLSVGTDFVLEALGIFSPVDKPLLFMPWMAAVALFYRGVFAVVGGYVTAKLAPSKPMRHVIILAVIGTVLGILGTAANWSKTTPSTLWYPILLVPVSLV